MNPVARFILLILNTVVQCTRFSLVLLSFRAGGRGRSSSLISLRTGPLLLEVLTHELRRADGCVLAKEIEQPSFM